MGDLIKIYTPNCRIKIMYDTNDSIVIGVHPSFIHAKMACDKCKEEIKGMCPVDDPKIIAFVIEESS